MKVENGKRKTIVKNKCLIQLIIVKFFLIRLRLFVVAFSSRPAFCASFSFNKINKKESNNTKKENKKKNKEKIESSY